MSQADRGPIAPGKRYAAETIRSHYSLFAGMMKKAVARGLMGWVSFIDIELPKSSATERRYLAENQVAALVDAMPGRYKVLVIVGAYLGLRWARARRASAVRTVTLDGRSGFQLFACSRRIERSNGQYAGQGIRQDPVRTPDLKMPAWVAEALTWQIHAFPHDEWVFPAPGGRLPPLRQLPYTGLVDRHGRLRVDPFDFHELRHTAGRPSSLFGRS